MTAHHHLDAGWLRRVEAPEGQMDRPYAVVCPGAIAGWPIVGGLVECFKRSA